MSKLFHASLEGAQHGPKGLAGFLKFVRKTSATGAQPSNFMLENPDGGFLSPVVIQQMFNDAGLHLDGISAHCPFWVLLSAWTGTRGIRPFIPPYVANMNLGDIESWAEDYILSLLDLSAELGVKVMPMFWGLSHGMEVASGYPWPFFAGPDYDLVAEGDERFVAKTANVRKRANELGIKLCHEIHPGTAAQCASDFQHLLKICDYDECLAIIADPSHCWENEKWEIRFRRHDIGQRIYAVHMKNHHIKPNMPLRSMEPDWKQRGMQFTELDKGDLDLVKFTQFLIENGYPQRYCELMGTETAPLVVEAEDAFRNPDQVSIDGIEWVADNCCFDAAQVSFEKAMGAAGAKKE